MESLSICDYNDCTHKVDFGMKIKFMFCFLILIQLVACSEKKEGIDSDLLLSAVALQPKPDRAENYDRDVQIITHTPNVPTKLNATVGCNVNYYSDEDVDYFVRRLKLEIARYPRGYWIKANAERVVLCRSITLDGRLVSPFSTADAIFLIVEERMASRGEEMTTFDNVTYKYFDGNTGINHELTHSVDRNIPPAYYVYSDWLNLNYSGFEYGKERDNYPFTTNFWNPLSGFVAEYGTTNFQEDRATIGALIMGSQPRYNKLVQICQTDPIVAAKVRKIVAGWNAFWPFPGAENTEWKIRMAQVEKDCK